MTACELAASLLEDETPKEYLRRRFGAHTYHVSADKSNDGWYNIQLPVVAGARGRYFNVFRPHENPAKEMKGRLFHLVRTRKGYQPGDTIFTPWGNFRVTDTLSVENA